MTSAGERVLAIGNLLKLDTTNAALFIKSLFRRDAETTMRHACATLNARLNDLEIASYYR